MQFVLLFKLIEFSDFWRVIEGLMFKPFQCYLRRDLVTPQLEQKDTWDDSAYSDDALVKNCEGLRFLQTTCRLRG